MSNNRKRGGQPRNTNARTHGFYSQDYTNGESFDLETIIDHDLTNEIELMRVCTRRLLEIISEAGASTPEKYSTILGVIGLASMRTASLLKAQKFLGNRDNITEALNTALAEVIKELNIPI